MIALTGTEKQISWAEEIRAKKFEFWNAEIERLSETPRQRYMDIISVIRVTMSVAETISDASYWIDGRDNTSVLLHCAGVDRTDARYGDLSPRAVRDILMMI